MARVPPFQPLLPGGQPSAAEYNRLGQAVARLSGISGAGVTNTPAGVGVRPPGTQWVLARITGNDGGSPRKYSWVEQRVNADGSAEDRVPGMTASTTVQYAVEANGVLVADNTLVWIRPGVGPYWVFCAQAELTLSGLDADEEPTSVTAVTEVEWTAYGTEGDESNAVVVEEMEPGTAGLSIRPADPEHWGLVNVGPDEQIFAGPKWFNGTHLAVEDVVRVESRPFVALAPAFRVCTDEDGEWKTGPDYVAICGGLGSGYDVPRYGNLDVGGRVFGLSFVASGLLAADDLTLENSGNSFTEYSSSGFSIRPVATTKKLTVEGQIVVGTQLGLLIAHDTGSDYPGIELRTNTGDTGSARIGQTVVWMGRQFTSGLLTGGSSSISGVTQTLA